VSAPRAVAIVGGGQGGCEVAAALRAGGHDGPLTMICEEPGLPYERPPLSKALLTGALAPEQILLRPASFFREREVELVEGRAVRIDRERRRVELGDGSALPYDHLVLATGARNRPLQVPGADLDGVLALRTLPDALELRERLAQAQAVAIIGAGFIGLEVATAAANGHRDVTVLESAERPMTRTTCAATAAFFSSRHEERGVAFNFNAAAVALTGNRGRVRAVEDADGRHHPAELALIAIGILPNDELAAAAGLPVDRGVLVDAQLRTADPAISAIGDCARFPSPLWSTPVLLESVQNASDQAHAVAARLLGHGQAPYAAVPWFWSDQAGVRLQLAGRTADAEEVVLSGDPAGGRFSALCFSDGRLHGVESVGRPGDHVAARRLLASRTDLSPAAAAAAGFDLKAYARAA
jgi:3-phenylpropionate/trans-cinnamate dioxygenase ferredoxin reductase subunit